MLKIPHRAECQGRRHRHGSHADAKNVPFNWSTHFGLNGFRPMKSYLGSICRKPEDSYSKAVLHSRGPSAPPAHNNGKSSE